ncbi:uncharacterized protein LOC116341117 isoform X2 [Contarinia nasturtii]|uniref:uncharacterized protein LOC116341117 isoform X2 n=1 Tax=Contarinia nasturtii TaxID=265458 RepID=UPI0012D4AB14|nr:uncharacterized protein LOC116341117 isoform X2 [Contarinia nasturtii]
MENFDENENAYDKDEVHAISYSCIMAPNRCTKRFLNISDTIIAIVIVTPLVVSFWYGTWSFMDTFSEYFPAIPTLLCGSVWNMFIVLSRHHVYEKVKTPHLREKTIKQKIGRYIFTKLFIYVFSITCIMVFRAIFLLCAPYDVGFIPASLMMIVCGSVLVCLKSIKNIIAPPMAIATDCKEVSFAFPTRFKTHASKEPAFYFIDCAFSVIVIGTLVVLVWRSLWVIFDLLIFPREQTLSAWYSLAIGYGIVAITFALQPLMKLACDRLTGLWRIAACDAFLFFSFVGTVNVWRGVWQLLDLHLFPENPVMSNLLCHGVSFFFLAMLNCSNSVLVRGVFIDAEEPMGQCVIFPVYYIRLFVQKERTKKQRRILDALEKGDLQTELLEKSEKNTPKIVKSSAKSIEMTNMANIKPTKIENGYEKENYPNGEHKIGQ